MSARGPAGVLVLVGGEDEGPLVQAIDAQHSRLVVVRRPADLAEVEAACRAGVARLCVLGAADPDLDARVIAALHGAGAFVLVVGGDAARSRQMGADAAVDSADVDGAVAALTAADSGDGPREGGRPAAPEPPVAAEAPPDPARDGERGRIVAVWGTGGAPGRSTVAVNLAAALAARGRSVVLVDADVEQPSLAVMVGADLEVSGVAALARYAARGVLGADLVARAQVPVGPGLDLVTGLGAPERWRELSGQAAVRILRAAAERSEVVVADLAAGVPWDEAEAGFGGGRDDVVREVLAAADAVVVVGRADVVGLERLARAGRWLRDRPGAPPSIVAVNRVRASAAGAHPRRSVMQALRGRLAGETVLCVPEDPAVDRSLLRARAAVEAEPRAESARALAELAREVGELLRPGPRGRTSGRRTPVRAVPPVTH